jgi:hypothetical protein
MVNRIGKFKLKVRNKKKKILHFSRKLRELRVRLLLIKRSAFKRGIECKVYCNVIFSKGGMVRRNRPAIGSKIIHNFCVVVTVFEERVVFFETDLQGK